MNYLKTLLLKISENLKCRYFYAQSFIGINNLAKAQKEYEKVIEQSPNSELAKLSSIAISRIHGYSIQKTKIDFENKIFPKLLITQQKLFPMLTLQPVASRK